MRALLAVALVSVACVDPQTELGIERLGPEDPAVPEGPLHRPGQPCLVCHGGQGPAKAAYAFAGTVYLAPSSSDSLPQATVVVIDAAGSQRSAATNCAGNFYFPDFEPDWPVWVKLELGDESVAMDSAISREGSCAKCHTEPASASTVGQVYFFSKPDAAHPGRKGCPP